MTPRDGEVASPDPVVRLDDGEIPSEVPFTIRQVDKARDELTAPPDIVIVDGGINDVNVVNVYNIVVPFNSSHMLPARTQSTARALE